MLVKQIMSVVTGNTSAIHFIISFFFFFLFKHFKELSFIFSLQITLFRFSIVKSVSWKSYSVWSILIRIKSREFFPHVQLCHMHQSSMIQGQQQDLYCANNWSERFLWMSSGRPHNLCFISSLAVSLIFHAFHNHWTRSI